VDNNRKEKDLHFLQQYFSLFFIMEKGKKKETLSFVVVITFLIKRLGKPFFPSLSPLSILPNVIF